MDSPGASVVNEPGKWKRPAARGTADFWQHALTYQQKRCWLPSPVE